MSLFAHLDNPSASHAELAARVQSLVDFYRHVQTDRTAPRAPAHGGV